MLNEYDKHLVLGRRRDGWTVHELTQDLREYHNPINYSDLRKEIEDYLWENSL